MLTTTATMGLFDQPAFATHHMPIAFFVLDLLQPSCFRPVCETYRAV